MEIINHGEENAYLFEAATGGWSFYICYGKHTHGYYIAIPNWGVCVEAAESADVGYNTERLSACSHRAVAENAEEIAKGICAYMKCDY